MSNELRNLKEHGGATLQELQQYLATMKGKSTQEMLGSLAESGLMRATVQAFLGCLLFMGLFTAGPYFLNTATGTATGGSTSTGPADATKPATPTKEATANNATTAAAENEKQAATADATKSGANPAANLEKAAKVLGIDETKSADPKSNPREKDIDSLLDKIK